MTTKEPDSGKGKSIKGIGAGKADTEKLNFHSKKYRSKYGKEK
jgi:hypothetical protein